MMLFLVLATLLQATTTTTATMKTVDKGPMSGMDAPRQATVHTPAEFATLWKSHAADRKMPDVDFTKNMVVGIFLGSRPTAGPITPYCASWSGSIRRPSGSIN